MKVGLALGLLAALVSCGCAGGDTPANPNLLAPKAILAAKPGGNATLFVHSAFGDHPYDWIAVSIDNLSVDNRTDVYSFEADVPAPHYFLEISAGSSQQQYHLRARVDTLPGSEKAAVSVVNEDGKWADAKTFALPWERVLDRKVSP